MLTVAGGGPVSYFTDFATGHIALPAHVSPEARRRWLAAMTPIEPVRFVHRAAPASILFQSARRDQFVSTASAERLHAAAPPTRRVTWYDADHALPPQADRDLLAWLATTIGTTPPGPADEAGPRQSLLRPSGF